MKKWIILFIVFLSINVYADTSTRVVTFNRCVDGDTAVFNVDNEEVKFRFLAIDTPETVHPTKAVEEFGKDASEYTCTKLTNATEIIVEYENSNKTDKYGRSLGWIWVDGSLLQKELIDVGYAKVAYIYGKYRYTESLCLAQSIARKEKYGLWHDSEDEGYCLTVDLTGVTDNINYDGIHDYENITEEEKKTYETLKKIDKVQSKINDYIDNNSEKVMSYMYYAFIGIGIVFVLIKEFKK